MSTGVVDEIKSKLDIVQLISEYLPLKKAGSAWKACCPFHHEKSPSFMVNVDRQRFHCFGCFPPGQKIRTPFGFHEIETIVEDDFVVSGRGAIRKVIRTLGRHYEGDLVDIQLHKLTYPVSLTVDHKVFVVRGSPSTRQYKTFSRRYRTYLQKFTEGDKETYFSKVRKYFPLNEVPAGQIRKGDVLLYPIDVTVADVEFLDLEDYSDQPSVYGPKPPRIELKQPVTSDLLRLFGYYIAEGSNHRAYIRFSLGLHEEEFAKEITGLLKGIFGLDTSIHRRHIKGHSGLEITCCHSRLANIFGNLFGKGADKKHVPFVFQQLPFEKQKVLIDAIKKGDGHVFIANKSEKTHHSIMTVSRTLAEQVSDMLLRGNLFPSVHISPPKIDTKGIRHKEAYHVYWSEQAGSKYDNVYYHQGVKYWLLPILSLEKRRYSGPVYNLTVEADHSYATPSFAVSNCGEDGDIFGFVMRIEGMDFPDALRVLAKKAGVILRQEDAEMGNAKQLLMDINRWAARYWHEVLLRSPQAEPARAYVKKRALKEETVEDFLIGYAPDAWETTLQFLRKKGYKDDDIFRAGVVSKREPRAGAGASGTGYFDRFRNRLMFSIRDVHGNVVGFTGRVMPDAQGNDPKDAKYVNTQQTLIYNKSAILFCLDKARQEIRKQGVAVVVEGNMDAIASHQAGVKNVVASSGTAFTGEQLALLKRYTNKLVLSFDNDAAGENAARRSIDAAVAAGFAIRVLRLPPGSGKDPDDCIRKSPEAWKKAIAEAVPFMDWYIELVKERTDLRDPDAKRDAADGLLREVAKMTDPVEQSHWTRVLARLFETHESLLFEKLKRMLSKSDERRATSDERQAASSKLEARSSKLPTDRWSLVSEYLLAILYAWPEFSETVIGTVRPEHIDPGYQELYRDSILRYNAGRMAGTEVDSARPPSGILDDREYADKIAVLELRAQKEFGELTVEERRDVLVKLTGELKKLHVTHRQHELTRAMAEAEKIGDGQKIKEIQEQINELLI